MTDFFDLTYAQIRDMSPVTAERVLLGILAKRATVSDGGAILRWSEYNENPDPLINRLLAKLLIMKMDNSWFEDLDWDEMVVVSIENSASYLAVELSFEVMRAFALSRPLRIVRARKFIHENILSPAMNETRVVVDVKPITAGGAMRHLVASLANKQDLHKVQLAIVADDFRATGSTLSGGVELARQLFAPKRIIPVAAMGKSWQETVEGERGGGVEKVLTALDVRYWWDEKENKALISINNLSPQTLEKVSKQDFVPQ
jgi:adenine/guanine phosphoribosyltransferase-like PRPP-binding protein